MLRKGFILLVVLLLVACPVLAGCDNGKETKSDTSGSASGDVTGFPYEGKFDDTILILGVNSDRHVYGELQFVPYEESSGSKAESSYSVVNTAVKNRNDFIEETYGLTIEMEARTQPLDEVMQQLLSADCEYDIICDAVCKMLPAVTQNVFISIDDIVDLDNQWWDRNAVDALTLSDKHYFLAGDMLITDDDNTYLTLFNKKMYEENGFIEEYGTMYEVVERGDFTLDFMTTLSRVVSHTDSDGQWGFNATYGNLSHSYGTTILYNGAGRRLAEVASSGEVVCEVGSTVSVSTIQKIYDLMSDQSITQRAELIIGNGKEPSTYGFSELEEMFVEGRGLFYNTTSSSISILKNSESDINFGVVPIPKYDEAQQQYYSPVNRYHSSVIGIPLTNDKLDATAFLLEALGYYSSEVKNAYFEKTLKLQAVELDEDARMLDLIYDNKIYDIGSFFEWGSSPGLVGFLGTVITEGGLEFTSKWEAIEQSVISDMEKTVLDYQNSIT